jgi:hypothetical protein
VLDLEEVEIRANDEIHEAVMDARDRALNGNLEVGDANEETSDFDANDEKFDQVDPEALTEEEELPEVGGDRPEEPSAEALEGYLANPDYPGNRGGAPGFLQCL